MTKETRRPPRRSSQEPPIQGDSISGTVGSDAKGVVIGKNVFQSIVVIGTLKIPVLPVLVLIVLVLGAAAFLACGCSGLRK